MAASWRKAMLATLAVSLFAALAPGLASAAAPQLNSADVFGNVRPGETPPNPNMDQYAIFPFSRPIPGNEAKGRLFVVGNATPGSIVDVTVTDGLGAVRTKSFPTQTVEDPQGGYHLGDFPNAGSQPDGIDITEMGTHAAGLNGACATAAPAAGTDCDPGQSDPAYWGGTVLTVSMQARDANDASLKSPVVTKTITKYAGAPVVSGQGDFVAPSIAKQHFPPTNWCHFASRGPSGPGGSRDGACGSFTPIPDVFWLPLGCWNNPIGSNPMCQGGSGPPYGYVSISGSVADDGASSLGTSSEIQNITITATQGSNTLWSVSNVLRSGPTAGYSKSEYINDYVPNYPQGTAYKWTVVARDAWGNKSTVASGNTTIYPY